MSILNAILDYLTSHQQILLTIAVAIGCVAAIYLYDKYANRKRRFSFSGGEEADYKDTVYHKGRKTSYEALHEAGIITIIIIAILLILDINGVDVAAPLAGLGIAGTIIGLALQDLLKDAIMGLRIVGDEYYTTGDCVRINGITGIVVNYTLLNTKIENVEDHSIYTICNGQIVSIEKLTNLLDILIPFPYGCNHEQAKNCVQHICGKTWMLDGVANCYYKGVYSFEDSSILYKLRCFCPPEMHPDMRLEIQGIVREVFDKEGIEIPFNQLDVHLDNLNK